MIPPLEPLPMLVARFCVFGSVLFVGMMLILDPPASVSMFNDFASAVRRLDSHVRMRWRDPFFQPRPIPHSARARALVRFIGAAIALFGLLSLAGIIN